MARRSPASLSLCVVIAALVSGWIPTRASAQVQVCSGLLPLAAIPPSGFSSFETGCAHLYTLKPSGGSGGNFAVVDFPVCGSGPCAGLGPAGAAAFRCLFANGYDCCVFAGDALTTEPGSIVSLLAQGIQNRFDADSDQRVGICFAAYTGNGSRLLSLPIADNWAGSSVQVIGFATAFLAYRPVGGQSFAIALEFLPAGVVATHAPTWGALRIRYR